MAKYTYVYEDEPKTIKKPKYTYVYEDEPKTNSFLQSLKNVWSNAAKVEPGVDPDIAKFGQKFDAAKSTIGKANPGDEPTFLQGTIGPKRPQTAADVIGDPGLALKNALNKPGQYAKTAVAQGASDIAKGRTLGALNIEEGNLLGRDIIPNLEDPRSPSYEYNLKQRQLKKEQGITPLQETLASAGVSPEIAGKNLTSSKLEEMLPFLKGTPLGEFEVAPLEWLGAAKPIGALSRGIWGKVSKPMAEAIGKAVPVVYQPLVPTLARIFNATATGAAARGGSGLLQGQGVESLPENLWGGAKTGAILGLLGEGMYQVARAPVALKKAAFKKSVGKMADWAYGEGRYGSLEEAQKTMSQLLTNEINAHGGIEKMKFKDIKPYNRALEAYTKQASVTGGNARLSPGAAGNVNPMSPSTTTPMTPPSTATVTPVMSAMSKTPQPIVPETPVISSPSQTQSLAEQLQQQTQQMTPEQIFDSVYRSPKAGGILNETAYNEAMKNPKPFQTAIDLDGMKDVNDTFGHQGGDLYIKTFGEALKSTGLEDTFHLHGDEFAVQGNTKQELRSAMEKIDSYMRNAIIEMEDLNGNKSLIQFGGFSYGIGKGSREADAALYQHKAEREAAGLRHSRRSTDQSTETLHEGGREGSLQERPARIEDIEGHSSRRQGVTSRGLEINQPVQPKKDEPVSFLLEQVPVNNNIQGVIKALGKVASARSNADALSNPPGTNVQDVSGSKSSIIDNSMPRSPEKNNSSDTVRGRAARRTETVDTQAESGHGTLSPVKRKAIIDKIEKDFFLPIRDKRLTLKKALGQYNERTEVTRLKHPEDIATLSHELGHHLTKTMDLPYYRFKELQPLGKKLYPNYNGEQQMNEGLAEFFRMYFTAPKQAEKVAPEFSKYLNERLNVEPEIKAKLKEVQDLVQTYQAQSGPDYIHSHIVEEVPETDSFLNKGEKMYKDWVDDLHPIFKAMEELSGQKLSHEEEVKILENPYIMARLARASNRAASGMLIHAAVGPDLKVNGPSYREIMEPVKKDIRNFVAYIVAKRAVELEDRGIQSGFDYAKSVATVQQLESPLFMEVAEKRQKFMDNLLDWLVDSGFYGKEDVKMMRELNKNHVPFYRAFGEESLGGRPRGKKVTNIGAPVKKIKGSERSIIDPIQSDIKNVYYFLDVAKRNKIGALLADLADTAEGKGWLMEKIPAPMEADQVQLERLRKELEQAGIPKETLDAADLEKTALVFNPVRFARIKEANENIITVKRDGKVSFYQVHPDLYRALQALDDTGGHWFMRFMGALTNILKTGILFSPKFIQRNLVKDTGNRIMITKGKVWQLPFSIIRGMIHVVGKTDKYVEAEVAGAFNSAMVNLNRENLRKHAYQTIGIYSTKEQLARTATSPLRALEYLLELSDEVTRMGEYLTVTESKGGNTKTAKLTGAYAARESGLDFARAGTKSREVNRVIAFFNANIQGIDKIIREFRTNPGRMLVRGSLFAMMSLAVYALNRDKKEYEEEPSFRKDLNWIFYGSNGKAYYIPKPYETGLIFGSSVERILEALDKKDPKLVTELLKTFGDVITPNLIPTIIAAPVEWTTNYDMFLRRPIVSQGLQNLPPEHQYTNRTSEAAKTIGRLTKQSPIQIEHAVKGYTGSVGMHGLDFLDIMAGTATQKKTIPELIPGATTFTGKPYAYSVSVDEFYSQLDELKKKEKAVKDGLSKKKYDQPKLAQLKYYEKLIKKRREQSKMIQASKMSPEKKREQVDKIHLEIVSLTRMALGKSEL